MGARKKTTRVQNLRADELVKLIFTPVTDGKRLSGPARTAHVRFVEALLAATIGVGEKFQQLLEDGRRHTAKRRKRKATTQPRVDLNDFGRELMGALANCWDAYRSAANPLTSLSKRKLYRLPKRIMHLAEDIETVNSTSPRSPLRYLTMTAISADRHHLDPTRTLWNEAFAIHDLPRLLREYACGLADPPGAPARGRLADPSGVPPRRLQRHDLALDAEMQFLNLVKSRTGSAHYPEAGILLEAAFVVATKRSRSARQRVFDEKALERRQSRYRRAKKRPAFPQLSAAELLCRFAPDLFPEFEKPPDD